MNDILCFDIETIPKQTDLNDIEKEEIEKKVTSYLQKNNLDSSNTEEYTKAKRLIMATSPYFGEIICIGMYRNKNGLEDSIALIGKEKEILERFWKNIKSFNGLFVSFNGLEFDVPFIIKRSMYHKILPTNNHFLDMRRYSKWPHFDVRMVMTDFDKYGYGNLKIISNFLGIFNPKDGEVKAENVEEYYKQGKINEIADYCLKDVKATYECYSIIKHYFNNK